MGIQNVWTWSDIVQLLAGFILFVLGVWIGKTQERAVNVTQRLAQEVKFLQTGIAELQIHEKIGVIGWGLQRVSQGDSGTKSALLYDCLAVLPMLEFSGDYLAKEYIDLLYQSLVVLTDHCLGKRSMSSILANYSIRQAEKLKQHRKLGDLAQEVTNAVARYLDNLKSNNEQKVEEICSQFLSAEQVKEILNTPIGDPYSIMKILTFPNRNF